MSDSRDRDPDPDDLRDVLEDLRRTLDDLEAAVDRDEGERERRQPPGRGEREPPRGRDIVRFTESYTIPTVISVLETTIQSLELLRGVLRLADPDSDSRERRRTSSSRASIDRRMVDGTERALEDLRRALTGEEVPSDPVAGEVLGEARALTSEIESLLREQRTSTAPRSERAGVVIPVDDGEGDGDETASESEDGDEGDETVSIDIDAELASIRDEVEGTDERAADSGEDAGDREDAVDGENDDDGGEGRTE